MPFNLEKTGVIYILVDPRNDEVRYVGATQNPGQRKRKHMSGSDMATGGWVTELIRLGLLPRFEIAHEDVPGEMLERIEAEEINERSKSGSVLLNQSCMVWANKWRNFAEMVERKIRLGGTDAARAYREIAEYRSRYRRDMDIYRPRGVSYFDVCLLEMRSFAAATAASDNGGDPTIWNWRVSLDLSAHTHRNDVKAALSLASSMDLYRAEVSVAAPGEFHVSLEYPTDTEGSAIRRAAAEVTSQCTGRMSAPCCPEVSAVTAERGEMIVLPSIRDDIEKGFGPAGKREMVA